MASDLPQRTESRHSVIAIEPPLGERAKACATWTRATSRPCSRCGVAASCSIEARRAPPRVDRVDAPDRHECGVFAACRRAALAGAAKVAARSSRVVWCSSSPTAAGSTSPPAPTRRPRRGRNRDREHDLLLSVHPGQTRRNGQTMTPAATPTTAAAQGQPVAAPAMRRSAPRSRPQRQDAEQARMIANWPSRGSAIGRRVDDPHDVAHGLGAEHRRQRGAATTAIPPVRNAAHAPAVPTRARLRRRRTPTPSRRRREVGAVGVANSTSAR